MRNLMEEDDIEVARVQRLQHLFHHTEIHTSRNAIILEFNNKLDDGCRL